MIVESQDIYFVILKGVHGIPYHVYKLHIAILWPKALISHYFIYIATLCTH